MIDESKKVRFLRGRGLLIDLFMFSGCTAHFAPACKNNYPDLKVICKKTFGRGFPREGWEMPYGRFNSSFTQGQVSAKGPVIS